MAQIGPVESFFPKMSKCLDGLVTVADDVRRCRVVGGEKIGRFGFPSFFVERHPADDFTSHRLLEDQAERRLDTTRLSGVRGVNEHRGFVLVVI